VVRAHHPDAQDGDPQVAGGDVGEVRERPGAGLCGGHACASGAFFGRPIRSDGKPQLPM
jgi:hypothetical protein